MQQQKGYALPPRHCIYASLGDGEIAYFLIIGCLVASQIYKNAFNILVIIAESYQKECYYKLTRSLKGHFACNESCPFLTPKSIYYSYNLKQSHPQILLSCMHLIKMATLRNSIFRHSCYIFCYLHEYLINVIFQHL